MRNILGKYSPKDTAIVVVDMQVAFCAPYAASVQNGVIKQKEALLIIKKLVPQLARFLSKARKRKFQIIYSISDQPDFRYECAIMPELKLRKNDLVWKRKDINTTFFKGDESEKFRAKLSAMGIKRYILTGVYSDMCVLRHLKEAEFSGVQAVIVPTLVFPPRPAQK